MILYHWTDGLADDNVAEGEGAVVGVVRIAVPVPVRVT